MTKICAVFSASTGLHHMQKMMRVAINLLCVNKLNCINRKYIDPSVKAQLSVCPSVLQLVRIPSVRSRIDLRSNNTWILSRMGFGEGLVL